MNTTNTLPTIIRAVRPFANRSRRIAALHDACVERTLDALRVTATDMEVACTITLPPDGEPVGTTLHDSATGEPVTGRDPLEYPAVRPAAEGFGTAALVATLDFADLRRIAETVAVAADDESSRYALGGVLIEGRAGEPMVAVATDGRRLHAATITPAACLGEAPANCIVPRRLFAAFVTAVRAAARAGHDATGRRLDRIIEDGVLKAAVRGNEFILQWDSGRVTVAAAGRIMEGRFPRWRDCMPKAEGLDNQVDAPSLSRWCREVAKATKAAADAARPRHAAIEVARTMAGKAAGPAALAKAHKAAAAAYQHPHGVALTPEGATARGCEMKAGIPFRSSVMLDADYLADALDGAVAFGRRDEVAVRVIDPQSAVTIRGGGFFAVVMPLAQG